MAELASLPSQSDNSESPLVTRAVWQAEIAHRNGIGHAAMSNLLPPPNIQSLQNEQEALQAFDKAAVKHMGAPDSLDIRLLAGELEWEAIDEWVERGHEYKDPAVRQAAARHALTDPRIQDYMGKINLDYLDSQHTALKEVWPGFKKEFTQGVRRGISLGYLPQEAERRTLESLDVTAVQAIDLSLGDHDWRYRDSDAVYDLVHDGVRISERDLDQNNNVKDSLAHEFVHKISGGSFIAPKAGMNGHRRTRVGFSNEQRNGRYSHGGLNEAVTELTKHGIMTGDFETIDPDKQAEPATAYLGGLKVLDRFVSVSGGIVNVRSLVHAFTEDSGPEGSTSARRELARECTRAFGPGALEKLDVLCIFADSDIGDNSARYMSRIHPPEFAQDGTIIRRGMIDTEGLTLVD